ncbi:hypothetical protein HDU83_005788 [Entophlyctis luteolus]|nr:hypothetical protein HDU83_005788 [Entophlyctis luteolus]
MATTKYGRNERQEKKKIKDLEDKADDIDEYLDEFLKLMPSDGNSIQPSDPLAYLETGLNYLVVMHPLVTLGFFALRAVYKLAMAKKLENKAKAELFGKFASAVNKLNCLNEMDAAVLQKLPKNQQSVRRNMENALDFMLDVAEFLLSSDASAWETVTGARTKKYKNAQEHIEECMRAIDNSTSTLMIVIATHLLKKNTALKRSSVQVDAYPLSKAGISRSIRKIIAKKGNAIKNKGTLNPAYSYFQDGKLVINSKQTLSSDGDASTKFYTVTGDCIIFDSTANYVLLEIRCPHEKDEVSMRSKFHYGGLLGTPGSFYRHKQDNTHINPDFQKFSNRILNEALKLFANPLPTAAQYDYVFPQFDNFRDIRWYLSESYVPSLALQFAARLSETEYENGLDLPELNRPNGSCDKAYWVDFRIIRKVYDDNKELFEMFAGEYDEIKFQQFVRSDKYFSLGADGTPVNKSPAENSIIRGFADSQVIQFNEEEEYLLRDFAFDHIQNIVSAFDVLLL